MKKIGVIFLTIILFICITPLIFASSFEYGIPKGKNHNRPNPGNMITNILEDTNSYYIGEDKKEIYLTFDCGYENGHTAKILDTLKVTNTKASFFITGHYLDSALDLVKRMNDEGHVVGNHTIHHYSFNKIDNNKIIEEVEGLEKKYKERIGSDMSKFVRPPKGHASRETLEMLDKMGYTNVFWSLAYVDWYKDRVKGKAYAYNNIVDKIHNGAIVLLHNVSKDNADALYDIINKLKSDGYEFKTLYDLKK